MNDVTWEQIETFNLDSPISEYGFSTRVAAENYWTIGFTEQAILEYKKFMYLAATSDSMVSPSEIVDVVWHTHLIFTKSYSSFCSLLGKKIEHIPSTHNPQEVEKFKLAKQRTVKLYEAKFGKQPSTIWNSSTMYEVLKLKKFKFKLRTLLLVGIGSFLIFLFPFYFIVKPLYINLQNPDFILGYWGLIIATLGLLEIYNNNKLVALVNSWDKDAFIFKLTLPELIYLSKPGLENAIHSNVNQLIEENEVSVSADKFTVNASSGYKSAMEYSILELLKKQGVAKYPILVKHLLIKPVFKNISRSMDAIKKYANKSDLFGRLFTLNFIVLAIVLMLGITRLIAGLSREKPIALLLITLFIYSIAMVAYLFRTTNVLTTQIIPKFYKRVIIPALPQIESKKWSYFLLGESALFPAFLLLVTAYNQDSSFISSSSGTSCGSNCGSSCSSCGGCGGD